MSLISNRKKLGEKEITKELEKDRTITKEAQPEKVGRECLRSKERACVKEGQCHLLTLGQVR